MFELQHCKFLGILRKLLNFNLEVREDLEAKRFGSKNIKKPRDPKGSEAIARSNAKPKNSKDVVRLQKEVPARNLSIDPSGNLSENLNENLSQFVRFLAVESRKLKESTRTIRSLCPLSDQLNLLFVDFN